MSWSPLSRNVRTQVWYDGLIQAIESLSEMPERFALITESKRLKRSLRAIPYKPHRIIYEIDDLHEIVYIVRLHHFARKPLNMKDLA